jgi:hypothetical protein
MDLHCEYLKYYQTLRRKKNRHERYRESHYSDGCLDLTDYRDGSTADQRVPSAAGLGYHSTAGGAGSAVDFRASDSEYRDGSAAARYRAETAYRLDERGLGREELYGAGDQVGFLSTWGPFRKKLGKFLA